MQRFDTRFLEIPDRLSHQMQRHFFKDVAATPRARVLMKNISMLSEDSEYLLPDELMEQVPERLRRRLLKHREDEQKHYGLWRKHLESRGELLEQLPTKWKLPFDDFVEVGWIPSPEKVKRGGAVQPPELLRLFAMSRVLESRVSAVLSYFGEACRGRDESVCSVIEEILRDETYHLAYVTEELELMGEGQYKEYAFYLKHKAWEAHTRWQARSMSVMLNCFLADPDFAGGGLKHRFWSGFRDYCERAGAMVRLEEIRPLSYEEFKASSLGSRINRVVLQLPDKLWGEATKSKDVVDTEGEATIRVRIAGTPEAVFAAAANIDAWHLWHANTWHASLRQPGGLRLGNSVVVRLRGGGDLSEVVRQWEPARQRAVLECRNPPFPLASYTSTVHVEAAGDGTSELVYRMDYRLRKSALVDVLSRLGIGKALRKTLEADFEKFKALFENAYSTGNVFELPVREQRSA